MPDLSHIMLKGRRNPLWQDESKRELLRSRSNSYNGGDATNSYDFMPMPFNDKFLCLLSNLQFLMVSRLQVMCL